MFIIRNYTTTNDDNNNNNDNNGNNDNANSIKVLGAARALPQKIQAA